MASPQESGILSLTRERARVNGLPLGSAERQAGEFDFQLLIHLYFCQQTRETGLSSACMCIDAMVDGAINPEQPYLTWQCCTAHRAMRDWRADLVEQAKQAQRLPADPTVEQLRKLFATAFVITA